jgi:CRISPR system Cascade subunit CasB
MTTRTQPQPEPAATSPARPRPSLGTVGTVVGQEVERLQRGYLQDHSTAVAALARLRRGAGKDAATIPDLWGLIDTQDLYDDPALRHQDAENAVYVAATLWSLHQQSRGTGMHTPGGNELGAAVRRLMPAGEILDPIRKRFVRAGTAPTLTVLAARLREITVLLRGQDISLDYALLADQLYQWQRSGGPDQVRRSWGRSFHAYRPKPDSDPTTTQADPSAGTDPKDTP